MKNYRSYYMKKIIFLIVALGTFISPISALEIDSKRAVLYNLNENSIVYEKNKDEKTSIASLTKIMTVLVAIENISDFEQKITINVEDFKGLDELGAYQIGLKDKEIVTYDDLLYATMLASGADAARALAINISKSEKNFVNLMNQKADELNLKNTHFVNTVGLDDKNHYSTVDEVAKLLTYALKNKKFKTIFTKKTYTFTNKLHTVKNSLIRTAQAYNMDISYIKGSKTGFTSEAGRALASIAHDDKNNIDYLLVTTNAEKVPNHLNDAITIYNYYFNNYKYHTLVNKNENILTLNTKYSKLKKVNFKAEKKITKYLKNDFQKEDVKLVYSGTKIISPKNKKGEKLGNVKVMYQNEKVANIPIVLKQRISYSLLGFLFLNKYLIIAIILLFVIFIYFRKRKSH